MVLSIIAQAVNAVSAPCPMLDTGMSKADHATMMHMPAHDMTAMNHPTSMLDTTPSDSNCCGDESCPMNSYVMGFNLVQPVLAYTSIITHIESIEGPLLYLSLSSASLYRPPISV